MARFDLFVLLAGMRTGSNALEEALYRIAQEALNNVIKHARASHVFIELRTQKTHVYLRVRDDGIGIGNEQLHASSSMGLVGMRERATLLGGELTIISRSGSGTLVSAAIFYRCGDSK